MNVLRQQLHVPTDRHGVYRERALGREPQQVVRTSRLWSRTGETLASKRLPPDDLAAPGSVHIGVPHRQRAEYVLGNTLEPAVHAERETKAGTLDCLDHLR